MAPPSSPLSILFVGAGAVGQVYALHAQRAGARVGLYIKPHHKVALGDALPLYQYASRPGHSDTRAHLLRPDAILTSPETIGEGDWDVIMLCVSSTALRKPWLEPFLARAPQQATIVTLQPGPHDHEHLAALVDPERLVSGMIGFIAWQGPLEGESLPGPGLAYWLPPTSPSLIQGAPERVEPLVALYKRGGLPLKRSPELSTVVTQASSTLNPFLAALELEGWSFKALRRGDTLGLAIDAMREITAARAKSGASIAATLRAIQTPVALRALMRLGPALVPFPLEAYLRAHFTKVGDQTRDTLRSYLAMVRSAQAPSEALEALIQRLDAQDVSAAMSDER